MWSAGTIFYELVKLCSENPKFKTGVRNVLFKGQCCYPLSPKKANTDQKEFLDQIQIIVNKVGPLKHLDTNFITSPDALQYINNV